MSKRNSLLIALSMLILSALACQLATGGFNLGIVKGSGNVVTQERPVSGFTGVDLGGIGNMTITVGDQEALTIEAEDNLIDYIQTEVRGDTLYISGKEGIRVRPTKPINYYLTVKSLDHLGISGLGSIKAPALQATDFKVGITGGGNIEIESLNAGSLLADLSGLGSFKILGGTVGSQSIHMSGGGNFDAKDLQSTEAKVDISGLGSATLRVSDSLQADISGGGSVKYYGDPQVSSNVSGLGKVEKVGD